MNQFDSYKYNNFIWRNIDSMELGKVKRQDELKVSECTYTLEELKVYLDEQLKSNIFSKLAVFKIGEGYQFAYCSRPVINTTTFVSETFHYFEGENLHVILEQVSEMTTGNYVNNFTIISPLVGKAAYEDNNGKFVVVFTTKVKTKKPFNNNNNRRNYRNNDKKFESDSAETPESGKRPYKKRYDKASVDNFADMGLDSSEYNSYMYEKNQRKRNFENKRNRK